MADPIQAQIERTNNLRIMTMIIKLTNAEGILAHKDMYLRYGPGSYAAREAQVKALELEQAKKNAAIKLAEAKEIQAEADIIQAQADKAELKDKAEQEAKARIAQEKAIQAEKELQELALEEYNLAQALQIAEDALNEDSGLKLSTNVWLGIGGAAILAFFALKKK